MKALIAGTACVAVLALTPAAFATPGNGHGHGGEHAHGGSSAAAKACAAEKHADHAAFKAVWGKHAMRDCIRAGRTGDTQGTVAEQAQEFANAAQECRAERDADPTTFQATYGTNANHRNAFGKCVSSRVHEQAHPQPSQTS